MTSNSEIDRQENFPWHRTGFFSDYNTILGKYKIESCLKYMHGSSVLDLACGDGFLTSLYCQKFKRVVGVDASNKHLEEARKRLPQVQFIHSLIEDITFEEQFDNVLLLDILEHVKDPLQVLQMASRHLKPEGTLIIHVPNSNAINRRIAVLMGTLETCGELSPFDLNVAGHRRSYVRSSLISDVEKAGLTVIDSGGIFFKMLSTPQMDWFLKNGLWEEGGFGWGRVGAGKKDWKSEFCRACYEIGKEYPDDCNIIYAIIKK